MNQLASQGWCVVEDVLPEADVLHARDIFWKWAERILGMERTDPRLMETRNWFTALHGILKHYGVGQSEFMWYLRGHDNVQKIFSHIWKTRDLLSSMDGLCVVRPPENSRRLKFQESRTWLHTDQTPDTSANAKLPSTKWGAKCIQGAVNLFPSDEDDAGFYILDGSHNFHSEFFRVFREEWENVPRGDFFILKPHHIEWFEGKGCRRMSVAVPSGSMTLWDSRLIHCGKPPSASRQHPSRWRLTAFICMTPASVCDPKVGAKRKKWVYENRTTSHWPTKPKLNAKRPRISHVGNIPYREEEPFIPASFKLVDGSSV